jgi:uncharacterized membrane protein
MSMAAAAELYDWLLLLHIVAAMVWVGGVVALSALVTAVLRNNEPAAVGRFAADLRLVGPLVLGPAPALLLGLGIWMVLDSDAWGFDQTWIQLAFALFGVAFLIGVAHQSRALIGARRAAGKGDHSLAARLLRRWSWGTRLILLILLVAAWDMVMKPGL